MKNYIDPATGFISGVLATVIALVAALLPLVVFASEAVTADTLDLTTHTVGYLAFAIFAAAYILVTAEEFTHLRKSKPVIIAAGVALMGQARGMYTFFGHLRWTPVIALGYGASILVHMWINAAHFT